MAQKLDFFYKKGEDILIFDAALPLLLFLLEVAIKQDCIAGTTGHVTDTQLLQTALCSCFIRLLAAL